MTTTLPAMATIARDIRAHVVEWFLSPDEAAVFQDTNDLRATLSSLRVLSLVLHIERTYGFKVDVSDITPDHFGSIERIAAYVARRAGAPCVAEG